jgi:tetratricopeptide (TPR) repeat protein
MKPNLFAAEKQFKKTDGLRWFDDDYRIYLGLGEACYRIATLYRNRLDYFKDRVAEEPGSEELYADEMNECREGMERRLQEAIENLEFTLTHERQEENIEAILLLGQANAYGGDKEKAVDYLLRGLDLLESSTSFQQSRIDSDQQMTGDGRRYFERQIRKNLKWEKELRGILAFVYSRQENYEKALEQYDILEERDLFDETQHYNRGLAFMQLGRYEDALMDFDRYLKRAGAAGKEFDEDEHFHRAFQNMEACKKHLNNPETGQAPAPDRDS